MTEFNFIKAKRVYRELYYQFPKVFITSDKYADMSNSTKIAYMLLKARLEFAVNKDQVDEEGNVYFTYTIKELCNVLNCGNQKVNKIKKELESYGLLLQKNQGFNKKTGTYNANRLYLAELAVDENDIYLLQQFDEKNARNVDKTECVKITHGNEEKENAETLAAQEGVKIIHGENVDKSEGMKITHELDNVELDTKNIDTKEIDTPADDLSIAADTVQPTPEKIYEQDRWLRKNFTATYADTFFEVEALEQIAIFSPDINAAAEMIDIAYQAKKKVEHRRNVALQKEGNRSFKFALLGDSFQSALTDCVRRFLTKEKINRHKEKPYRDRNSVWYATMETFWEACMLTQEALVEKNEFPYGERVDLLPGIENLLRKEKQKDKADVQKQIYARKNNTGVTVTMHNWLEG